MLPVLEFRNIGFLVTVLSRSVIYIEYYFLLNPKKHGLHTLRFIINLYHTCCY